MPQRSFGMVVFLLALIVRVGWIGVQWQRSGAQLAWPDEHVHWQLARNLVTSGAMRDDAGQYAVRMPLYPLFLAPWAILGDSGILLARLAQAALGAAAAWLAWSMAQRAGGRCCGILAGLLVAFDPFGIFFSNLLLTEALFTPLALAATACAWRTIDVGRRAAAPRLPSPARAKLAWMELGVGVLCAAAILTRQSAVAWVALLLLLLWFADVDRLRGFRRCLKQAMTIALLMACWGLRNHQVLGNFAWLSTNGGVTLYDALGPQADGSSDQSFLAEMPELARLSEVERDRRLREMAIQSVQQDPARVFRLADVKFLRMWNPFPNVAQYRAGTAAWAGAAYTVVVLLLAMVATVRGRSSGQRWLQICVWLPVLSFTLLHCVYIGSVRYRVPLMPFLAISAGLSASRPGRDAPRTLRG